jgi:hypothetical protein
MVMDVQEYAKLKGIPVGAIPADAFYKAQTTDTFAIRKRMDNSKAEAFKKLCFDTKQLVENCTSQNKVSQSSTATKKNNNKKPTTSRPF